MLPSKLLLMVLRIQRQALSARVALCLYFARIYIKGVPAEVIYGALSIVKTSFIGGSKLLTARDEGPLFLFETEILGIAVLVRVALVSIDNS